MEVSAAILLMVGVSSCTTLPGSAASTQSVCAGGVSIGAVAVTIESVQPGASIHMQIDWHFADNSDAGTRVYPNVASPLVAGQTYSLPGGDYGGLVDLGRCLDVVGTGVTYRLTVVPVIDPRILLLYAANGGRVPFSPFILGHLPYVPPKPPVVVPGITGASQIDANGSHTCAVQAGAAKCWGTNGEGELGNGSTTSSTSPVTVSGLGAGVASVASGDSHSCALLTDGTVRCWGWNYYGDLGNPTVGTSSPVPVEVTGLSGVTQISAGLDDTCALLSNGTADCWGRNDSGQLGIGTGIDAHAPVPVVGLTGVSRIQAGFDHTCAIVEAGAIKCWGEDSRGELGDGGSAGALTPVDVIGVTRATTLSLNGPDSCAVIVDGSASCWGTGPLGNGTTNFSGTPLPVAGLTTATGISIGLTSACASRTDGTVVCWGQNGSGQLGDPNAPNSMTPIPAVGVAGASQITVGVAHACALVTGGSVMCWGSDYDTYY